MQLGKQIEYNYGGGRFHRQSHSKSNSSPPEKRNATTRNSCGYHRLQWLPWVGGYFFVKTDQQVCIYMGVVYMIHMLFIQDCRRQHTSYFYPNLQIMPLLENNFPDDVCLEHILTM